MLERVGGADPPAAALFDHHRADACERLPVAARRIVRHRDPRVAPDRTERRVAIGLERGDKAGNGDDRLALSKDAREREQVIASAPSTASGSVPSAAKHVVRRAPRAKHGRCREQLETIILGMLQQL